MDQARQRNFELDHGAAPPVEPRPNVPREPLTHPPEDFLAEPDPADEELGPAVDPDALPEINEDPGRDVPRTPTDVEILIAQAAPIYASPAIGAFLDRRLRIEAKHGELASTALSRPPYLIAGDASQRIIAAMDRLRGNPGRDALELARDTVAGAGAHLTALYDAIEAALAALPGEDRP